MSALLDSCSKTDKRRTAVVTFETPGLDRAPKCPVCAKNMTEVKRHPRTEETWICQQGHATMEIF